MINRKLTALLLAFVLVLSLCLTACGGKKEEAPAPAPEVETEAPETEVPEAETEAPEAEEPVEEPAEEPETETPAEEPEEKPEAEKPAETPAAPPAEEKPAETPAAPPAAEAPAAGSVDLAAFYASLVETYGENFPANMNLCDVAEMLESFYPGLAALSPKQMMIYQPMMGAVVCEIALVEVADAAHVETVKALFQSRIDAQVAGGAWYPESIEGWEKNSRIVANGNFVMMIAYSECDAVVEAFNGLF